MLQGEREVKKAHKGPVTPLKVECVRRRHVRDLLLDGEEEVACYLCDTEKRNKQKHMLDAVDESRSVVRVSMR